MIAVDTNILIYANRAELPLHSVARNRLTELAEGSAPWALPVVVAWGFVRIVTQPIFDPPTPMGQAIEFLDRLLASPVVRVLGPGARHWELLRTVLDEAQARGGLVTDAVIVALCKEHGVDTVLSNDRDFHRFPNVRILRLDS
ncbi:MAG: TA system VapC family ribonuclease toxin [Pseudonocardiaceae bacterium]